MSYRAIKPCRFAGRDFRVGEIVPEALLAPGAKKRLLSMGPCLRRRACRARA